MTDEVTIQRERFDKVHGTLTGLPDVRMTKPSTILESVPIINLTTTAVVQTYRNLEDGTFVVFLQLVDAAGHTRLVIPDKVARAIYRQRDALMDRSTPESRKRASARRERERRRDEKAERSRRWRETHPQGMPGRKKP